MLPLYRNQSIDLLFVVPQKFYDGLKGLHKTFWGTTMHNSIDWFLYEGNAGTCVKGKSMKIATASWSEFTDEGKNTAEHILGPEFVFSKVRRQNSRKYAWQYDRHLKL